MSPRPTAHLLLILLSCIALALLPVACAQPEPRPVAPAPTQAPAAEEPVIETQVVEKVVEVTAITGPTEAPAAEALTPTAAPAEAPTPTAAPHRVLTPNPPIPAPTATRELPDTGGGPSIPEFPWPPPRPSSLVVVPCAFPVSDPGPTLGDVNDRLRMALDATGYYDLAYFLVPDGFALVTRLEQINPDGSPKNPPARWEAHVEPMEEFSLAAYIRALFAATPGYYRVIVFAVTDQPIVASGEPASSEEASGWLAKGSDVPPESIMDVPMTDAYHVTALIYQFRQPGQGEEVVQLIADALPGRLHLEAAQLWNLLAR